MQNKLPFSVITVIDIFQSHLLNYARFLFLEQLVGCADIASNLKAKRILDREMASILMFFEVFGILEN